MVNANLRFRFPFQTRAISGKLGKMVKEFKKRDVQDRAKSGMADWLSPVDELLSSVLDTVNEKQKLD